MSSKYISERLLPSDAEKKTQNQLSEKLAETDVSAIIHPFSDKVHIVFAVKENCPVACKVVFDTGSKVESEMESLFMIIPVKSHAYTCYWIDIQAL